MKITKLTMFGGVAVAALLVAGGAKAATYDLIPPDYSGSFTINGDGTITPVGGSGSYTGVLQQDKLWDTFTVAGLPAGSTVVFSFASIAGQDAHTINFTGAYLQAGSPYTVGYDIHVESSSPTHPVLVSTASDLVQTLGTATLAETLTPNTGTVTPAGINFTQNGSTISSGNFDASFSSGVTTVAVTDVLTLITPPGWNSRASRTPLSSK